MSIGSPNTLPTFFALVLAWMVGVVAWAAPTAAQGSVKRPVVVMIFDEFSTASLLDRTGKRIHRARFPNFHRLSKQAAWYPHNTTVADYTVRAVPAILTGKSGPYKYADYREHPDSIYTLLRGAGYRFRNLEIYTQVCPPRICAPPGPAFLRPRKKRGEAAHEFSSRIYDAADQTERRSDWLKSLGKLRAGQAAVGHILLPHGPYRFLPNGRVYRDTLRHSFRNEGQVIDEGEALLDSFRQRILFQVGFIDRILGMVRASLKKAGVWDKTMLVVAGDHGVSLRPGLPARKVVSENRHEIGLTPLLVKYPDRRSVGRQEAMSQSIDILPTIADVLGLSSTYTMEGSVLSEVTGDRTVEVTDSNGASFPITRPSAKRWLRSDAAARARGLGTRGLKGLGPVARAVGKRAPRTGPVRRPKVTIAGRSSLRQQFTKKRRPALIQGFVAKTGGARRLVNGSRLLLALNGRFVSSTSVYSFSGRRAFSFLIHPKYLRKRTFGRLQIFQVSPSGRKVRIF